MFYKKKEEVVVDAESECPIFEKGKQGKLKGTKSRNLLERLRHRCRYVLNFMVNPDIDFTNNLAERDLRMLKVHQKISGQFKSFRGFEVHARIRSYISTLRKRSLNVFEGIQEIFQDQKIIQNQVFN